ncbi:MAG: SusC/RagA family TonB-linked outer membrane protein [Flavobacteriaceae bacterium]
MKFKMNLALLAILLCSAFSFAQTQVNGTVTGSDGIPVPGANVVVQNTNNGTTTDFDGNFTLSVSSGDVLVFSYLGYITQAVTFEGQDSISVVLEQDMNELDEIVVTGYGTRKKSQLTGAVAQVKGENIANIQAVRVDDALAGKMSGVLIQNQSGEPGADPKIQIRAAASINGNSSPLIVVDGYPISGSLATVNPNDIQSLEVLKDASSAAIYGSRGANGVILVTTKRGDEGKPTVSFDSYISTSSKYRENILMSGPEWAAHARTEIAAGNWDLSQIDPAFVEYRLSAYEDSPGAISPEDWLFRNGSMVNHNLSVSGGSKNVKYFASLGYQDTEGVVITQGFERINARMNIDAQLSDKFKVGMSFNGFNSTQDIVAHDMRDLLRAYGVHPVYHTAESIAFVQRLDQQAQALGLSPFNNGYRGGSAPFNNSIYTLEPGDWAQDWHYGRANNGIGGSGDAGPATKLDNADRWVKTYFANLTGYLRYKFNDDLSIKTVIGADIRDTQDYYYQGLEADSRARTTQTDLDQIDVKRTTRLSETTLSFSKLIGDHDIDAVLGYEFQDTFTKGTTLRGTNVPYGEIVNFGLLDPADISISERDETITRNSVFGRINYAFANKYLASVSVRRDGDSRFGVNNKYETFPAFSLGWNVHNESFFNAQTISLLKLRWSTGSLGTTSDLGAYNSLSLLNPRATIFGNAYLIPSDVANPDLTWQTNTETNYGVDLGVVDNRFRLSVNYYTSNIEDILINQSVSEVLGTTSIRLNSGDVESSGMEFELSANILDRGDFSWNLNANLSTVNTEITDLGGLDELPRAQYGQSGRGPIFRNYVGGEIGEMWGLETTGPVEMLYLEDGTRHPNNTTGESYVVDQNGDGVIDRTRTVEEGGDLVKIGQATPDFYWGLNSSMNYKNFDLSLQFQGAQGAEVYNIDPLYFGSEWTGRLVDSFDANDDGRADHNNQHYIGNRRQTDSGIQDASYIALRNMTLGYSFDQESINKFGLSSARIYTAATNLFYLMADNYTSYNPEGVEITNGGYLGPTTYGVQVGASPVVRTFTLGINLKF